MKIAITALRTWLPDLDHALPSPGALRDTLDHLGIEVKRFVPPEQLVLELLANRGDHYCYDGIARELSAHLDLDVTPPPVRSLEADLEGPWPVRVEDEDCLVYSITLLSRGPAAGPLAAEALATLAGSDLPQIHPAVDATNLVNLEFGQPAHAFDADQVQGPVVVRASRPGESAWLLFTPGPVPLPVGTLIIADDVKVLAVAGVIGCEESKTTDRTERILLESATFDPVRVRKASRSLGVSTDSSARFERGADPSRPLLGAGRVAYLLEQAGWQIQGKSGLFQTASQARRVVELPLPWLNHFLGTQLSTEEVQRRLTRLGYQVKPDRDGLSVHVPPLRTWDVLDRQDLAEDLARAIGYNSLPEAEPPARQGSLPSPKEVAVGRLREVFLGLGFYEVVTDGFYSRQHRERLGLSEDHPLFAHVETQNALDRGYSLLKNNTLAQALDAAAANLRMRHENFQCFELTRTFHPTGGTPPAREREVVWALVAGSDRPPSWSHAHRAADPHFLAGLIEELAVALRLPLSLGPLPADDTRATLLHPGRCRGVFLEGSVAGVLGEVHPEVLRSWKIKNSRPCWLELDLERLSTLGPRARREEPPSWQQIERSLAFTLPRGVEAQAVLDALRGAPLAVPVALLSAAVTDRYEHAEPPGSTTLTFGLAFANAPEAAPSTEAINAALVKLADDVEAALGPTGVRRR